MRSIIHTRGIQFSGLYHQLALSLSFRYVRLPSLCRSIRNVLTSLMTGLKQSLWNLVVESESMELYVCIVRSKLHHDEIHGAAAGWYETSEK